MKPRCLLMCLLGLALIGCGGGEHDAWRHDPSTASLSLEEASSHPTRLSEPRHVFAQLIVDQGMWCDDDLEGTHCEDPPPAPSQDFQILEAACPDDACELVSINDTLGHLVEVTIIPKTSAALLRVRARAMLGADSVEAEAQLMIPSSD